MTVFIDTINRQVDQSVYNDNTSKNAKIRLASKCDALKKVSIVVAIATPIFAFFLPYIFGLISTVVLGLIGYDIFNIANNLGHAARLSAEGGRHSLPLSNVDMLLDSTILSMSLLKWALNDKGEKKSSSLRGNERSLGLESRSSNLLRNWEKESEADELESSDDSRESSMTRSRADFESDFSDTDLLEADDFSYDNEDW